MKNKDLSAKLLAITGTVLVWIPLLAPVVFSIFRMVRGAPNFVMDYLMPAELFLSVLLGGGILLGLSFWVRLQKQIIGWSLAAAVILLVLSQVVAVITGLASGATEPTGIEWALVVAMLVGYILAVMALGVGGIFMIRDLYRRKKSS